MLRLTISFSPRRFSRNSLKIFAADLRSQPVLPVAFWIESTTSRASSVSTPVAAHLVAPDVIELLERPVAGGDVAGQIEGEHGDVDALDDVFGVDLQPLQLVGLRLDRAVEVRVLQRDGGVARQRGEQVEVLAGKVLVSRQLAERDDPDPPSAQLQVLRVVQARTGQPRVDPMQSAEGLRIARPSRGVPRSSTSSSRYSASPLSGISSPIASASRKNPGCIGSVRNIAAFLTWKVFETRSRMLRVRRPRLISVLRVRANSSRLARSSNWSL